MTQRLLRYLTEKANLSGQDCLFKDVPSWPLEPGPHGSPAAGLKQDFHVSLGLCFTGPCHTGCVPELEMGDVLHLALGLLLLRAGLAGTLGGR